MTGWHGPFDPEAERSVLGGVLLANDALSDVLGTCRAEDFARDPHRRIFAAMEALAERSEPVDLITFGEELRRRGDLAVVGGPTYLALLDTRVPATGNIAGYARLVREKALARRLLQLALALAQEANDPRGPIDALLSAAEQHLIQLRDEALPTTGMLHPVGQTLPARWDHYEALAAAGRPILGTASGLDALDVATGGFHPGNLILAAGRPGMGKSALIRTILENVAIDRGAPVAFFSLEMTEEEILDCLVASRARFPLERLRSGHLQSGDWRRLALAAREIAQAPLFLDATPHVGVLDLRARLRRCQAQLAREGRPPLTLVAVDYLQLMKQAGPFSSRADGLEQISAGLKALAKEFHVPVVALSQLNRELERRDDHRPQLADLRGSGALEQDADLVLFVYRDEVYNKRTPDKGFAELILAKHRHGRTGSVRVAFHGACVRFDNLHTDRRAA